MESLEKWICYRMQSVGDKLSPTEIGGCRWGKSLTDMAYAETLLRLAQSIPNHAASGNPS